MWLDVLGSGSPVHGGEKMLIGGDGRTERQEGSRRKTRFSHQTEAHRVAPALSTGLWGAAGELKGVRERSPQSGKEAGERGSRVQRRKEIQQPALGGGFPSITERPPRIPGSREDSRSWKTGWVQ